MKILHVIPSANPRSGGPIQGIKNLALTKENQKNQIDVVTLDAPNQTFLKKMGVIKFIPLGPSWLKYGFCPKLKPWLKENVLRYDLVIINGIWQYHSYATAKVCVEMRKEYYIFTHGMLDPWFNQTYPLKKLKKLIYWPFENFVLRNAERVLFTCEDEKLLTRNSFPNYKVKELVVGYGSNPPEFKKNESKKKFLDKFPNLKNKKIVLFMSRIQEKKGCDDLIIAFSQAHKYDDELMLVLAGNSTKKYKEYLMTLIKYYDVESKVEWIGFISGELKWGALFSADVFALPSHQENFGIVISEALSCGLPVLITKRVNIWREIYASKAGLISKDNCTNFEIILQKWVKLDANQKNIMRKNALKCFISNFQISKTAKKLNILTTYPHENRSKSKFL